jgi:hypothetical protein
MALDVESIVDDGVNGQEALCRSRRLEPLQLAFAPSHRLVRILRSVVLSQSLFVASR